MPGSIFGTPGGSLDSRSESWASSKGAADYGKRGEAHLGDALNALIGKSKGSAVFHDVDDPRGGNGNIDHLLVAGRRMLILDSKVWAPGFYYTLGSKTYRGMLSRFSSGDPRKFDSMMNIVESLAKKSKADLAGSLIVAMPSSMFRHNPSTLPVRTGLMRPAPGAKIVGLSTGLRRAKRFLRAGEADPDIVGRLTRYVRD